MKSTFIPVACGIVLAAISAAGTSHWFSVRQLVLAYTAKSPLPVLPAPLPTPAVQEKQAPAPAPAAVAQTPPAPASPAPSAVPNASEEFLRSLVQELKSVKEENRALQDQVEETNRDIMTLQFRVDTHSSQFRPMPVMNEARPVDASHDLEPIDGVLPPLELGNPLPRH